MNKIRAAAIDFGSNSSRLLIAEYIKDEINVIYQDLITTRLAKSIDEKQLLDINSINNTIKAIKEFKDKMSTYKVKWYKTAGTSALREAKNSDYFIKLLKDETGIELDIISGEKEAQLTYKGVTSEIDNKEEIIIDIGGGSTEFIKQGARHLQEISINMGAVRFTEKFIRNPNLKISKSAQKEIIAETTNLLKDSLLVNNNGSFIGVGGTITTLAAIDKKLVKFEPEKIEGHLLKKSSINKIINNLSNMELNQRLKVNGLQKERADIIVAGSLILKAILDFFSADDIKVSNKDLLYGLIIEIFNNDQFYLFN